MSGAAADEDDDFDNVSDQSEMTFAAAVPDKSQKGTITEVPTEITAIDQPSEEKNNDSDKSFEEDLTIAQEILEVNAVLDWEKRFRLAHYTDYQKQIVKKCLSKTETLLRLILNDKEWTQQQDKDGVNVCYRTSSHGLNSCRTQMTVPFSNIDVFRTINNINYRKLYDENIDESKTIKKIAANVGVTTQLSKKVAIISPREFILVAYRTQVSVCHCLRLSL